MTRAAALAGAVVLAVALLAGCSQTVYTPRTEPSLSSVHTSALPVLPALDRTRVRVSSVDIPFAVSPAGRLLLGDVRGGPGSEIVVLDASGMLVYDLEGELITRVEAQEPSLASGVLADADGDGKLDVVTGVSGGTDPVVRVYNGLGKEIVRRRLVVDSRSFGALLPLATAGHEIFVSAGANWRSGPRGVFRLSLPRLDVVWFSAVPTGVDAVQSVGSLLAVSTTTQQNGEYQDIGVDGESRFGFDTVPQLIVLGRDGRPVVERTLGVPDADVDQSVRVLALGETDLLVHREGRAESLAAHEASSGTRLGELAGEGAVVQVTAVESSDAWSGVVVVRAVGLDWNAVLADARLREQARWRGTGPAPRVLAVVGDPEPAPALLVARDDRLQELGTRPPLATLRAGRIVDSVASVSGSEALIVVLGERLSIVRIRFAGREAGGGA